MTAKDTDRRWEELRDKALKLYEDRCDVHSETNFAAILAAFEVFNQPFKDRISKAEIERGASSLKMDVSEAINHDYAGGYNDGISDFCTALLNKGKEI